MPADFPELFFTMSQVAICKHYKTSNRTLQRWIDEAGLRGKKPKVPGNKIPAPDDFVGKAPHMTKHALRNHYKVGLETIQRWLDENNVSPAAYDPVVARQKQLMRLQAARAKNGHGVKVSDRSYSIYDEAADILRRERWVVFRCYKTGIFSNRGDYWRVGNVVCTPAELLERANRYRDKAA